MSLDPRCSMSIRPFISLERDEMHTSVKLQMYCRSNVSRCRLPVLIIA